MNLLHKNAKASIAWKISSHSKDKKMQQVKKDAPLNGFMYEILWTVSKEKEYFNETYTNNRWENEPGLQSIQSLSRGHILCNW